MVQYQDLWRCLDSEQVKSLIDQKISKDPVIVVPVSRTTQLNICFASRWIYVSTIYDFQPNWKKKFVSFAQKMMCLQHCKNAKSTACARPRQWIFTAGQKPSVRSLSFQENNPIRKCGQQNKH